jgi:uncharacterized membrane protein
MHPDALTIVGTLFWASVLTSFVCFLTDSYLHKVIKANWKPLLVLIVLVLIWRIPTDGEFFHGTEYEDSYVYTVAGRQMAGHFHIEPNGATLPYSINVCAVGSLASCRTSDNYPEHLIGYPYILSVFFKLLGYRPSIASIVNVVCACLADILIFLVCIVISEDVIAAVGAALIFAITPIFAVWGLETSAEPMANGCISLVLWLCLRYVAVSPEGSSHWRTLLMWCALTSTLMFSLTVKRENILLPLVLPLVVLNLRFTCKHTRPSLIRRPWWFLLSATLAVLFSFQLHLSQTQNSAIELLKKFPLTVAELISFFPVFISSFLNVQWYGGAAILVVAGIVVVSRRQHLGLVPLALFAGYLLLYAFHLRSYYEMQSGTTDSRAALRFSMSLMSMWSIFAGLGAASVFGWLRRTSAYRNHNAVFKWVAGVFVMLIAGVSYFTTLYFREDVVEDEFRVRVEPSAAAVQTASQIGADKTYIITLEPLILQMYAAPTVNLISLHDLNDAVIREIGFDSGMNDLLYLDEKIYRNPVDAERYMSQLTCLNQFKRSTLFDVSTYSVIRLSKGNTDEPHTQSSNRR